MQDLARQEEFEIQVLDLLNTGKILRRLVFIGGTMLRLCHGLNRFSVDLDFWLPQGQDRNKLYDDLKRLLSQSYTLKDAAKKYHTVLFEIKSRDFHRSLKIEIRDKSGKVDTEQAIAYSPYSNLQVILRTLSLRDMMQAKIESFLDRKEIRDVFDIEFLVKKGIKLEGSADKLKKLLKTVDYLNKKDYTVKLGSILEEPQRKYYVTENFKILKSLIMERLG